MEGTDAMNLAAHAEAFPLAIATGKLRSEVDMLVRAGLSTSRLCVEAGITAKQFDAFCQGRSTDDASGRLAAWLQEREAAQQSNIPGFVETPTAQAILNALEFARNEPGIAQVIGEAGVGKTVTARQYATASSNARCTVLYVCASSTIRSPSAIVEEIAEAVGLVGNAYRLNTLAKQVARSLGTGDLIIVDEAQFLDANALHAMRQFRDQYDIGVAYLGNPELFNRLYGRSREARFAQITSRIDRRVTIKNPTEADVDAILTAWGISGRKERDYAVALGTQAGGLRTLSRILKGSRRAAAQIGCAVDVEIMKAVAAHTGDGKA